MQNLKIQVCSCFKMGGLRANKWDKWIIALRITVKTLINPKWDLKVLITLAIAKKPLYWILIPVLKTEYGNIPNRRRIWLLSIVATVMALITWGILALLHLLKWIELQVNKNFKLITSCQMRIRVSNNNKKLFQI